MYKKGCYVDFLQWTFDWPVGAPFRLGRAPQKLSSFHGELQKWLEEFWAQNLNFDVVLRCVRLLGCPQTKGWADLRGVWPAELVTGLVVNPGIFQDSKCLAKAVAAAQIAQ